MRLINGIVAMEKRNWQKLEIIIVIPIFTFFSIQIPNIVPVIKEGRRVKIVYSIPCVLIINDKKIDAIK